jgi:hypothetical protein
MAGQTLGISAKVGIIFPVKWWFPNISKTPQLPNQVPVQSNAAPVDEPPARPAAAAPEPKSKANDGGGFEKTRESLRQDVKAGSVNTFGDFVKAAVQGPAGPIGATTFLGRLLGGTLFGGVPGADIDNSNQDPATRAAMDAAAAAAAAKAAPFNRAAAFKAGGALFDRRNKGGGRSSGTRSRGSDSWGSKGGTESRDPGREGKF